MTQRWAAALLFAGTATAEPRLVTNPEMCAFDDPIDTQEMGMELDATSMFEIEYYCEFDPPMEFRWDGDVTATRMGYCSEPGLITPMLVTFQFGEYEPGAVTVWWQDTQEPTTFRACP